MAVAWRMGAAAAAMAAVIQVGSIGAAASPRPIPDVYTSEILRIVQETHGASGAAVAAIRGDETFASVYGEKSRGGGEAVGLRTSFRMGSISKPITAAAAMKLAEQGRLDLRAPVRTYLPWFRIDGQEEEASEVTVAHLLGHTSGLSREFGCAFSRPDGRWIRFDRLLDCVRNRRFHFAPGSGLKYSNLGLALAGQVVAAAANDAPYDPDQDPTMARYESYVRENVLRPLGMTATFFSPPEPGALQDVAAPYGTRALGSGERVPLPVEPTAFANSPAYFMATNALDLPGLLKLFRDAVRGADDGVAKGSTLREMVERRTKDPNSNYSYGLGLMVIEGEGGRLLVGHSGGCPGYRSLALYDAKNDVGVAAVVNTHDPAAREIVDLLLKGLSGTSDGFVPLADGGELSANDGDVASPFAGVYVHWSRRMRIVANSPGDGIRDDLDVVMDGKRRRLYPTDDPLVFTLSPRAAFTDFAGERFRFAQGASGSIEGLTFADGYLYLRE